MTQTEVQYPMTLMIVDRMIEETQRKPRQFNRPLMGGAHQAPFDGEELGRFIRFAVLMEVRDRITGDTHTEQQIIDMFRRDA
jgi:hypothetical protein